METLTSSNIFEDTTEFKNMNKHEQDETIEEAFKPTIEPINETDIGNNENQEFENCQAGVNLDYRNESNQLSLLRHLLIIEREKNLQRRNNNNSMKKYLNQLQADYLNLQRDLVETLELGHKIKAQKEAQLESLKATLNEKDVLIEKLKSNLEKLDDSKLKEEFNQLLEKQNKLANLEKDQLKRQLESIEQQLISERISNSQILQEFQQKFEEQQRVHEKETNLLRNRIKSIEIECENLLNEPKNLIIKNLKEEKSKLTFELEELNLVLNETQMKYESLKKRLEFLLNEQEQNEEKNLIEMDKIQLHQNEQKRILNEMKNSLDDKEEIIQILQFNLQRSEKRVKNLIVALNGKESTYNEMIEELQLKFNEEFDKKLNEFRILERELIENKNELDKKQNIIIRLELEHENQLESIRNDRDQRILKLQNELDKSDKLIQATEIKLAKEIEEKELIIKQVEQFQKESQQFREESKRLSIEVTKCEAKLHSKQQELNNMLNFNNEKQIESRNMKEYEKLRFELDEAKRRELKLDEIIDDLRKDNDKLYIKIKLHENNMTKISDTIQKEYNKMIKDYERKLNQMRAEQSACDQNRIKYKRYGCKLKKYCEHLRKVHQHLCNPSICGAYNQKIIENYDNHHSS